MCYTENKFNIVDLFYRVSKRTPDKTALIYRDKKISFGDFEKSVTETAAIFLEKGIQKGDRVMVFVPMSDDLYRIVLALFRIGAVAVFLDEWVSIKRLNACCQLAQCKAFVGTPKARIISWFIPGLRRIPLHLGLHEKRVKAITAFPETTRDDVALITFTTGSTGTPKAAIRTHGLLFEQFEALTPVIKPGENEVSMPVLPIVLMFNLGAGITSVIAEYKANKPDSFKPEIAFKQLNVYSVNVIISSPFFVKKLSQYLLRQGLSLNGVQKIFTGGAPVFPAEAQIYKNAFPKADIQIVYGSTEAEPISTIRAEALLSEKMEGEFDGLHVGQPEDCVQVKVINITEGSISVSSEEELNQLQVQSGQIGEIIVSGKHVLRDYLHNPEASKRNKIFIKDKCWHRTGDSGFMNEKGELYLTGRCNTLSNLQGKIISAFIYENHFQNMRGVELGTVLAIQNKLVAIIELNDPSQQENVRKLIEKLPQIFDTIIFKQKIPRDPRHNSKIDYDKLRVMISP